jgi:hypothetical protein
MSRTAKLLSSTIILLFAAVSFAEHVDAVTPIKGVAPNRDVFRVAKRGKPIVLKTVEEAGEHFPEEELAKLDKQVDFDKQIVLLFAWRGSGQDRLEYIVDKSYPEQISFTIKPGRTRDLRPHVKIFALRDNVSWSVK